MFSDVIHTTENSAGLFIEKCLWSEYIGAKQILQASVQDPACSAVLSRILKDTKMSQGKDPGMSRQKRYGASQGSFLLIFLR